MEKSHHIILSLKSVFDKYECFDTTKLERGAGQRTV
jgi:hypothetical protein